jgi:hypothetical protein
MKEEDFSWSGKTTFYVVVIIILIAAGQLLRYLIEKNTEGLSVNQRAPSKEDCTSLIKPPAPVMPPYGKNTEIACNVPGDKRLRLKDCKAYQTFRDETSCAGCGGCSSCKAKPMLYNRETCFQNRFIRENLTTVKLPPVREDCVPIMKTTVKKLRSCDVASALENGDLIIAAKNMKMIEYMVQKLQYPGGNGFPSFYEVDGPVTVLTKDGKNYYYMIDYPIKYIPKNINKYVNTTIYSDQAMDAWRAGSRLQESCSPVIIFKNSKPNKVENVQNPRAPKVPVGECCKSVWGAPYGCGNWTLRV